MYIVPESKIAGLADQTSVFDAVEAVFAAMASGEAFNFPVVREAIGHEDALYGFKGGFDRTVQALGLKAGGYWPNNLEKRRLINHQSSVFLFDPDTGICRVVIGGNLLTALRTAAANAVSIKHLAPPDARVLGIMGTGHQSAFQIRAADQQRNFERIIGWSYHLEIISRLEDVAEEVGLPFESVSLERLGAESDVIISITSSHAASLMDYHVSGPMHIACMGTDTKGKQEVEAALVAHATVFTDEIAQAIGIGECQHALKDGLLSAGDITEIGAVINGKHPGRVSDEITLFDGTGVGLQDLAVADTILELAIDRGYAISVDF